MRQRSLNGKQKAAVLLISLGPETSAAVFKHLREDEIEDLTFEIANLRTVEPELKNKVTEEFSQIVKAKDYISQGGIEYARELLEKGLGAERADEIINKLTVSLQVRPFDFARKVDASQLLNFIQHEHSQTIALILAYLEAEQAATIISSLAPERQIEVAKRLATLDRTSPEVLQEIESALETRLSSFGSTDYTAVGGIDAAVQILNRVDRGTQKTIMESLEEEDPELADEIKERMFVFEDIVLLDDRSIQQVIREVDTKDWALALKTASGEVADRIMKNMSKRAGEMLREDIKYMGPVRLKDVEEAQGRIVSMIRRLEDAGEIIIARGGEDELVV